MCRVASLPGAAAIDLITPTALDTAIGLDINY